MAERCAICTALGRACAKHRVVSDPEATLDTLVQAASIPNLADLFRRAKAKGLILAGKDYGSGV